MGWLFVVVALLIATTDRGQAQPLPETRAVDAQIARGLAGPTTLPGERRTVEERIEALIPDAGRNCIAIVERSARSDAEARSQAQIGLKVAVRLIERSQIGAWLVALAASRDVTLCIDRATTLEAHYRSHLGLLGLNAKLGPAGRVVFLAHELAHVPQHPRYSNNRRFSPEDMLLLQRIREAAAESTATRVLWQLRQKGITAPWRAKLRTAYHDIAESFAATMADGHEVARELQATRSAFNQWFKVEWRQEIYDDLMLKTLARIAKDPIGLIPASRHLSDRFVRGIAEHAGQGFLNDGDGQALIETFRSQRLSADRRARLDAILAQGDAGLEPQAVSPLAGDALSAISPTPTAANDGGGTEMTAKGRRADAAQ